MQSLENLSREELIACVRELQAGVDLDFVSRQALKVLDNSSIPALIYDTDGDFGVLAANACMAALSGYPCDELTGLPVTRLLVPEDAERAHRLLRLPRQSGFASTGGWRHRTASGEVRHIQVSGYDLVFTGRRARLVIVQDVTRQKRERLMQQRLTSIVETSQDAILSSTLDGVVLSWNRAAERLFGHSAAEIVGRSEDVLVPAELRGQELETIRARVLAGRPVESLETVRLHRSGERLEVAVTVAPLADVGGRIIGASTVIRDLRPAREAERLVAESRQHLKLALQSLRERERQLESILNDAAEGMLVVSAEGAIERINLVAQRLFGYSAEEAQCTNLRQLTVELAYDGETAAAEERPVQWMRRLLGGRREVTGRRRDGSLFPLELSLSEITLTPGPPKFTALVRDITERKTWENRIYSLAYSDSLTGLPNRLLLRDRLEHAIASAQRNRSLVGVLFVDLDHFKAINDSYGHHAGDQLLREIGERAKHCVREIDTVCRLGGDEFVLVLPDLHEAGDAGAVARKLLAALSHPYAIDGRDLSITPTVGVSIYPHHGTDADTLIRNADAAMYHAKESGKNKFRFYEAM